MSFECFLEGDFTGSGNFKALLGARVGFNLWHKLNNLLRLHPAGGIAQAIHLLSRTGNWAAKVMNWMDFPSFFPQKKRHIYNMPLIINQISSLLLLPAFRGKQGKHPLSLQFRHTL